MSGGERSGSDEWSGGERAEWWSQRTGEMRESAGRESGRERDESWSGESDCVCRNVLVFSY